MRKINKLNLTNLILFIILIVFIALQYSIKIFSVDSNKLCALMVLLTISISLFTKGILFKSSNSIWFSLVIFSYVIFLILSLYFYDLVKFYASAILLLPAILGVVVYLIFREKPYIKISLLLLSICIPVILYNFGLLNDWLFLILFVLCGVVGFFAQKFIK